MTAPSGSEAWIDPIFAAVVSDVQASGFYTHVNANPAQRRSRGTALTAAVWVQDIVAAPTVSGLASTSARVTFVIRSMHPVISEPAELIDPAMLRAASNLIRRYHDNFDFNGVIRNVDCLGETGAPIRAAAGFLPQNNGLHRTYDIMLPLIVDNVWPQVQ